MGQTFHYKGKQGKTIGEATRQFMAALVLAGDPDYLEHHEGPPEMFSDHGEEESQFEEADVVVPATQLDAARTRQARQMWRAAMQTQQPAWRAAVRTRTKHSCKQVANCMAV
ncbi:hypothetical protein CYMTET_24705 [Cymbomonas tetramitiformis]|uniref:Uncharacterized protein n=1 Tax=Cymbomonas tetramitiformis TaxID=36881 RepID=A0AAE0FWS9_9CHLO|nr:hypothetical protein CYMTET_24705 [Cymbomonas tetramitiformis]